MGENKTKTKAAMLDELESIKGLLLEEDDIPILQEVIENKDAPEAPPASPSRTVKPVAASPAPEDTKPNRVETNETSNLLTDSKTKSNPAAKTVFEEQQDFFHSAFSAGSNTTLYGEAGKELMDTLGELEKHTADVAANKFSVDINKIGTRSSLAKATGENPFLPQHIRARLHGNNPPPLFEHEAAHKIATTTVPARQLGNTFSSSSINLGNEKANSHQRDIFDSIFEKMMPVLEKELRNRLEIMTRNLLDELNK
jgi:hypothetical protein